MRLPNLSGRATFVWVALVVLVAVWIQADRAPVPQDAHDHGPEGGDELPEGRFPVFAFGEPDIGAVTIAWKGREVGYERDHTGLWMRAGHGHAHGPDGHDHGSHSDPGGESDADRIAEQFQITARMLADRAIRPAQPMTEYGLGNPDIEIAFRDRLNGDMLAVMRVGDLLVSQYAYYATLARVPNRILLIPRYQINLLLALAFGEEAPSPLPERDASETVVGSDDGRFEWGRVPSAE